MAPDVGDIIRSTNSESLSGTYRVSGWMKALPDLVAPAADAPFLERFSYEIWLEDEQSGNGRHGPDKKRLVWCTREEAQYVTGSGVCGVIWRVGDCEITGKVTWSDAEIEEAREDALLLVGERLI
jgi:hypothetical protein